MRLLSFIGHAILCGILIRFIHGWEGGYLTISGVFTAVWHGWVVFTVLVEGAQLDVFFEEQLYKSNYHIPVAIRQTIKLYYWRKTWTDAAIANGLFGTMFGVLLIALI